MGPPSEAITSPGRLRLPPIPTASMISNADTGAKKPAAASKGPPASLMSNSSKGPPAMLMKNSRKPEPKQLKGPSPDLMRSAMAAKKQASEKQASEKQASEKQVSEKQASEKQASED
jgi:hypothetical protein